MTSDLRGWGTSPWCDVPLFATNDAVGPVQLQLDSTGVHLGPLLPRRARVLPSVRLAGWLGGFGQFHSHVDRQPSQFEGHDVVGKGEA